MDKFLEIFRLEPVESLKPAYKRFISGKMELIARIILDILIASGLCYISGANELLKSLFVAFNGVFIAELLWGGFKQFGYVQDIILHSIVLVIFVVVTVTCDHHLVGLALMGVAKCFSDFEYRNFYNLVTVDEGALREWEQYSARSYKKTFVMLVICCWAVLKLLKLI